jgi:hypothetical protein
MKIDNLKMTLLEWINLKIPLNEIIINCSPIDGSDSMLNFPIGISVWCKLEYIDILNKTLRENLKSVNSKLYSLSINTSTDRKRRGDWGGGNKPIRRQTILQTLNNNSFVNTSNGHRFFEDITKSKFVFSPEGNGIDTHRTYEALIFKSIPICEDNEDIKKKYEGLPVLYTTDYSEITEDYLYEKYCEMKNKTYDFSRLFLSFYEESVKNEIIKNGNFWVNKFPQHFGTKTAYPMDLKVLPSLNNIYDNLSFITVTNSGYTNMTLNCIESLKKLNININLKIFCLDKDCYTVLKDKHNSVFLYEDYFRNETRYNDENWNEFTTKKLDVMHSELKNNKFVLFTDGDIVFENPYFIIDCYRRMIENDKIELLVQDEHPINGICSGFYIIRQTKNTLNLFSNETLIDRNAYSHNDQDYINGLIQKREIISQRLPKEQYSNGRYYYEVLSKQDIKDYENYLLHFNWLKGGDTKRNKMIHHGKWYMGKLNYK